MFVSCAKNEEAYAIRTSYRKTYKGRIEEKLELFDVLKQFMGNLKCQISNYYMQS
ncbi:hypothetical protein [Metabacillus rhizolycopersici]|uniref:Uncharacterized protein n=1 Tax=Metabacillus rhizolycopersici TaxID=2875709 RepID=A0ABS7UWC1_9BACI|nr:hypothetical protein [Metabacillus rhizolycopersici]MBZ5752456.1 hypothetical protein [Metabacillus rhizolycopersici]